MFRCPESTPGEGDSACLSVRAFVKLSVWQCGQAAVASAGLSVKNARGWTGCLSNTLFPFSLDRQTTRGAEMATRTERRPLCDNPGPEVACSQDEFALFSVTSKPAYVQKPRVAFVRIIVTNSLNNCNIPK